MHKNLLRCVLICIPIFNAIQAYTFDHVTKSSTKTTLFKLPSRYYVSFFGTIFPERLFLTQTHAASASKSSYQDTPIHRKKRSSRKNNFQAQEDQVEKMAPSYILNQTLSEQNRLFGLQGGYRFDLHSSIEMTISSSTLPDNLLAGIAYQYSHALPTNNIHSYIKVGVAAPVAYAPDETHSSDETRTIASSNSTHRRGRSRTRAKSRAHSTKRAQSTKRTKNVVSSPEDNYRTVTRESEYSPWHIDVGPAASIGVLYTVNPNWAFEASLNCIRPLRNDAEQTHKHPFGVIGWIQLGIRIKLS